MNNDEEEREDMWTRIRNALRAIAEVLAARHDDEEEARKEKESDDE